MPGPPAFELGNAAVGACVGCGKAAPFPYHGDGRVGTDVAVCGLCVRHVVRSVEDQWPAGGAGLHRGERPGHRHSPCRRSNRARRHAAATKHGPVVATALQLRRRAQPTGAAAAGAATASARPPPLAAEWTLRPPLPLRLPHGRRRWQRSGR